MSNNGKPTVVSQPNREQAILEAAEREFLAKGFAGARTTSIAEAAGVTHALLHYYFRTKEQLFDRILDEKLRLMGQTVLAAFGRRELPLLERLKEGIETHFDFIAANPDMPRFIGNEVFSRPERYEAMRVRIRGITDAMIRELQSELDASAARGETEGGVDVRMLMLDIISSFRSSPTPSSSPYSGITPRTGVCFSNGAGRKSSRSSCGGLENRRS